MSQNLKELTEEELIAKKSFSYAFKQQVMKAWQPVPNLNMTIALFVVISIFFIVFGSVLLNFSNSIQQYSQQYDVYCRNGEDDFEPNKKCEISIDITDDMKAPVFVYYELDNFYQNHRKYVKSRSVNQLKGADLTVDGISSSCDPITTNKLTGRKYSVDGTLLDENAAANPCGLIAKSIFNDTFTFYASDGEEVKTQNTGIAWPADKQNKFKHLDSDSDWSSKQWADVTDERFMIWMRTASLPKFRKLWARVSSDITKGTLKVTIENEYDVKAFGGKKSVVLSTANEFGGSNNFLAVAYLVVGGCCFVVTIAFIVKRVKFDKNKKE